MNNYYMIEDNSNGKLFVVAVTVEATSFRSLPLPADLPSPQTPTPDKVVIDGAIERKGTLTICSYMFGTLTSFFSVPKLDCLSCNCLCKNSKNGAPPSSSNGEGEDPPSRSNGEGEDPPPRSNGEEDPPPRSNGEEDPPPRSNYKLALTKFETQEAICDQAFYRLSEFKLFISMQNTNKCFTEFKADYTKSVKEEPNTFYRICMRNPGEDDAGHKLLDGFYDGLEADTSGNIMSNGEDSRIVRFWKEIKGDSPLIHAFTANERKQIERDGSVPKHMIWGKDQYVKDSTTVTERNEFKKDMVKGINTATQDYKDACERLAALNFINEGDAEPERYYTPEHFWSEEEEGEEGEYEG